MSCSPSLWKRYQLSVNDLVHVSLCTVHNRDKTKQREGSSSARGPDLYATAAFSGAHGTNITHGEHIRFALRFVMIVRPATPSRCPQQTLHSFSLLIDIFIPRAPDFSLPFSAGFRTRTSRTFLIDLLIFLSLGSTISKSFTPHSFWVLELSSPSDLPTLWFFTGLPQSSIGSVATSWYKK